MKQKSKKKYVLKNDVIFKEVFSKKGNEEFLQEFLSSLLKVEIKKIDIAKEVELPIGKVNEKLGALDIKAVINDNTILNVEMQLTKTGNMKKRLLFYACRLMSSQLSKKEEYESIKKVIAITILDYNIFKTKEYITQMMMTEKTGKKSEEIEDLQLYFIELPKFRKEVNKIKELNKCLQWLIFIDGRDEERMKAIVKENEKIRKAKEEVEYLTGKEAEQRWAELREKWDRDYNSGMSYSYRNGEKNGMKKGKIVGKIEGEKKSKIKIAKAMLKKNTDIKFICEVTKLSKEEVEKLKK